MKSVGNNKIDLIKKIHSLIKPEIFCDYVKVINMPFRTQIYFGYLSYLRYIKSRLTRFTDEKLIELVKRYFTGDNYNEEIKVEYDSKSVSAHSSNFCLLVTHIIFSEKNIDEIFDIKIKLPKFDFDVTEDQCSNLIDAISSFIGIDLFGNTLRGRFNNNSCTDVKFDPQIDLFLDKEHEEIEIKFSVFFEQFNEKTNFNSMFNYDESKGKDKYIYIYETMIDDIIKGIIDSGGI